MLLRLSVELVHTGLCFGPFLVLSSSSGAARGWPWMHGTDGVPPAACPAERPHGRSGGQLSCEMWDEGSEWKKQLSKLLIYGNRINNRLNLQWWEGTLDGKAWCVYYY